RRQQPPLAHAATLRLPYGFFTGKRPAFTSRLRVTDDPLGGRRHRGQDGRSYSRALGDTGGGRGARPRGAAPAARASAPVEAPGTRARAPHGTAQARAARQAHRPRGLRGREPVLGRPPARGEPEGG